MTGERLHARFSLLGGGMGWAWVRVEGVVSTGGASMRCYHRWNEADCGGKGAKDVVGEEVGGGGKWMGEGQWTGGKGGYQILRTPFTPWNYISNSFDESLLRD